MFYETLGWLGNLPGATWDTNVVLFPHALSAADIQLSEVIHQYVINHVKTMFWKTKSDSFEPGTNPVTAAKHFHHRFNNFFQRVSANFSIYL